VGGATNSASLGRSGPVLPCEWLCLVPRTRPSPTGGEGRARFAQVNGSASAFVFMQVPEGCIAFVEELPGANTQGATLEEARENLRSLWW
jgi:hypothetical protein